MTDTLEIKNELNPVIWDKEKDMKDEVRDKLMIMAEAFVEYINVDDLDIIDATISGSNASYNYNQFSDIDLHLIARVPKGLEDVYQVLFDAKRTAFNLKTDFRIKGIPVEFYVQRHDEDVVSNGIYSLYDDEWIREPDLLVGDIDKKEVDEKKNAIIRKMDYVKNSEDYDLMDMLWQEIRRIRKSSLEKGGELSATNIAYKELRSDGSIEEYLNFMTDLKNKQMSLETAENS